MNFFEEQEKARNKTVKLFLLFLISIIAIVAAVNCLILALYYSQNPERLLTPDEQFKIICITSLFTILSIVIGSIIKTFELKSNGGEKVARSMGGVLLTHRSANNDERVLLNVVEEMSIASGLPVPKVYVIDVENINAFAAGTKPQRSVLAFTKGCLKHLNRDELQGVVGHEMSHIFNGDMRLNIKLLSLTFGLFSLNHIGRLILRDRSSRKKGAEVALGLGLLVLGSLGAIFGKIIKASISRQREWLADASAVQFTRNKMAVADALKKILLFGNRSYFKNNDAEAVSHMLFANGLRSPFFGIFNTHPPLQDRILALDPQFTIENTDIKFKKKKRLKSSKQKKRKNQILKNDFISTPTLAAVALSHKIVSEFEKSFSEPLKSTEKAANLLLVLLLTKDNDIFEKQLSIIRRTELIDKQLINNYIEKTKNYSDSEKISLIQMIIPTLKSMDQKHSLILKKVIDELINADNKINIYEISAIALSYQCFENQEIKLPKSEKGTKKLLFHIMVLLSFLCHETQSEDDAPMLLKKGMGLFMRKTKNVKLPKQEDLHAKHLIMSFRVLNCVKFSIQEKFINACLLILHRDNKITVKEHELIRAYSLALELPSPLVGDDS